MVNVFLENFAKSKKSRLEYKLEHTEIKKLSNLDLPEVSAKIMESF